MKHLWIRSTAISLFVLVLTTMHSVLFYSEFSLLIINKIFANASIVLIGLSMGAASFAYFIPAWKPLLIYRKHLGLIGFYCALLHGAVILYLQGLFPFKAFFEPQNIAPFVFAVLSTLVLTIMAVISCKKIQEMLPLPVWRRLLQLGHLALVFGLLHFGLKTGHTWIVIPPTPALLSFTFGVIVVVSRIALTVALRK